MSREAVRAIAVNASLLNVLLETAIAEKEAWKKAYYLSMPLLVFAQQKNWAEYRKVLLQMQTPILEIAHPSQLAWLRGRILLAESDVHDELEKTVEIPLLGLFKGETRELSDHFYAWAMGYFAATSIEGYTAFKDQMMQRADAIKTVAEKIWAYVLALQAAANAKDVEKIPMIISKIKEIAKKVTLVDALLTLSRDTNDYPAWALGIAAQALQKIAHEEFSSVQAALLDQTKQLCFSEFLRCRILS